MKLRSLLQYSLLLIPYFLLVGCSNLKDQDLPNYYILDYKYYSEKPELKLLKPYQKTLEVLDAEVNRTYSRSQLVVKENFSRVRYLPDDLWANRLNDAIPSIIVQRLRAYNIFNQVDRSTSEIDPDYYLETNILNLEKVESESPEAFIRLEFHVRDADTQKVLITYKSERYKSLPDVSMIYLIQTYNEMIMQETDELAKRCELFLAGLPITEDRYFPEPTTIGIQEDYVYLEDSFSVEVGELLLEVSAEQIPETVYTVEGSDTNNSVSRNDGEFGQPITLPVGKYKITMGEYQEIVINTEIYPKVRTVITKQWAELVVKIIDEKHNRVRMPFEIWKQNPENFDYNQYGLGNSLGDDDVGQQDKIWIFNPGTYMIKIGGGSLNELTNFATVNLKQGDSEVLTLVVDPTGEKNLLLGAGTLGEKQTASDRPIIHKGAIHGNISLAGNNNSDPDDPVYSVTLTGQLENSVDATFPLTLITARSIYDVGLSSSTGSDPKISTDSYSLKNVALFTPWEKDSLLDNFSFYARADVQTHLFNEFTYFPNDKNLILMNPDSLITDTLTGQTKIKTKTSFFPLKLKEGMGLTYRLIISPQASLSLRCGYGWQQEINTLSYSFDRTILSPADSLYYDIYVENPNIAYHGIESTLVLSAINILKFIRINSTIDVLFPVNSVNRSARFESENRINFRLFRNISLDVKLNLQYDRSQSTWLVYEYGSFLRISLYY